MLNRSSVSDTSGILDCNIHSDDRAEKYSSGRKCKWFILQDLHNISENAN
jgi:hypothetical protein